MADYPSDFLGDQDVLALSSMADVVVDRIERRLDARADRRAVQRELVRQIYKLRLDVKNISWSAGMRPSSYRRGPFDSRRN